MHEGQPSRTALGAAAHRAAHQVLDQGFIFRDPLALRILGPDAEDAMRDAKEHPEARRLRLFIAVRARFAEDAWAAALARGVRQLVILGAGLDTYAYRAPVVPGLRIFEVDHPATQAGKRQRLADAGIAVPSALTFAAVDFERATLADGLVAAGFEPDRPSFFTWLGVTPYLGEPTVLATLGTIAGLRGGAEVVFDYRAPPVADAGAEDDPLAMRVAAVGEAFMSELDPGRLRDDLVALGFAKIEDLGPAEIVARYFPGRVARPSARAGHIVHAAIARRG